MAEKEEEIQGYNRVADYEVSEVTEDVKLLGVNKDGDVRLFRAGGKDFAHIEIVEELPTEDIKENTLYIVPRENPDTDNIYDEYLYSNGAWEKVGSSDSKLIRRLVVTKPLSEIPAGKVWEEGTPFETMFRDLFNPVLYPTFVNPSAQITSSVGTLLECGTTINVVLTLNLNKGSILVDGVKQNDYAGDATGYSLNGAEVQEIGTFSASVDENNKVFSGIIYYAEGAQPKDSEGEDYGEPLPAGGVNSNTLTFKFVDAIWANKNSASEIIKLPLLDAKSTIIDFPACTEQYPETFDIPAYWTLKSLKVQNPLTGEWDNCDTEFSYRETAHDNASGALVQYSRYFCNLGYDMAARRIMVTWS